MRVEPTADGSSTLYSSRFGAHYHSRHGALQEARHVFVEAGFQYAAVAKTHLRVLELGFGTGLNAAVTCGFAEAHHNPAGEHTTVDYVGVEAYPLPVRVLADFTTGDADVDASLTQLHEVPYGTSRQLAPHFRLTLREQRFETLRDERAFDLIYYDAFGPQTQPELWAEEMFARLYRALGPGGVLVTYCAQGQMRRNMRAAGFAVERLPGPPGKREMTRGRRLA